MLGQAKIEHCTFSSHSLFTWPIDNSHHSQTCQADLARTKSVSEWSEWTSIVSCQDRGPCFDVCLWDLWVSKKNKPMAHPSMRPAWQVRWNHCAVDSTGNNKSQASHLKCVETMRKGIQTFFLLLSFFLSQKVGETCLLRVTHFLLQTNGLLGTNKLGLQHCGSDCCIPQRFDMSTATRVYVEKFGPIHPSLSLSLPVSLCLYTIMFVNYISGTSIYYTYRLQLYKLSYT